MPTLSICIPTYKRPSLLAELLQSIELQFTDCVEVLVGDDASGDGTSETVRSFASRIPSLHYLEHPVNIGFDSNLLALAAHARGTYMWFIGDDDRVEPDGIAQVLTAIERWAGIAGMTVGVLDYDSKFERLVGIRQMPETRVLHGTKEVFTTLIGSIGFISALVVRRDLWRMVCAEEPVERFKNLYLQVYVIGRMIDRNGRWGVLDTPCIGFRTCNDQFQAIHGWVDRARIDMAAYGQIAASLFPENRVVRRALRRQVFRIHVIARLRNAKLAGDQTPDLSRALGLLCREAWDLREFWCVALPTLLVPKSWLRAAKSVYQRYSSKSGGFRARAHAPVTR